LATIWQKGGDAVDNFVERKAAVAPEPRKIKGLPLSAENSRPRDFLENQRLASASGFVAPQPV
jgi:hypothetical protein